MFYCFKQQEFLEHRVTEVVTTWHWNECWISNFVYGIRLYVSVIFDTDALKMYQWYWYWYFTHNVSWYLILDTFFVSRYISWYMYHWYSPTLRMTLSYARLWYTVDSLKPYRHVATYNSVVVMPLYSNYLGQIVHKPFSSAFEVKKIWGLWKINNLMLMLCTMFP